MFVDWVFNFGFLGVLWIVVLFSVTVTVWKIVRDKKFFISFTKRKNEIAREKTKLAPATVKWIKFTVILVIAGGLFIILGLILAPLLDLIFIPGLSPI